jgi:poly-beta-1,6-N-acetyl-D-glucosamine synthase
MVVPVIKFVFWFGLGVVFYAYLGYGIVLRLLIGAKRLTMANKNQTSSEHFVSTQPEPKVTFIVCAFNEADWIAQKVHNSIAQNFPAQNLRFIFVTDGSSDATPSIATQAFEQANLASQWQVAHQPERKGKIAAFHRALQHFGTWEGCLPHRHIIVSTDANTLLNPDAVARLVAQFDDPRMGAVAGEKRIAMEEKDAANSAGEGIYWKYESLLKRWDAELWSVVGAAGELFALRADLYEAVPPDTIVEDFYMTMRIAQKGYRVGYEPAAYAVETSSASVAEEMKRKVRIAAGGLQAVARLAPLLNVFRYGTLSFQYISHRVLRWTLAPLALPIIFCANASLAMREGGMYTLLMALQILFYALALLGYILERRQLKVKAFFVPYYFCLMNFAMYAGLRRLLKGQQSVLWEKSARKL